MPTLEDELRGVLERYAGQQLPGVDRNSEVRRRIVRHRRMLVVRVAAALAVLAVIGSVTAVFGSSSGSTPHPAASHPAGPFPQYALGGKLASSTGIKTVAAGQTLTLTFTPTNWDFVLGAACQGLHTADSRISINGNIVANGACEPDQVNLWFDDGGFDHQASWSDFGVRLGAPATVTLGTVTMASTGSLTAGPEARAGLAVYENVPFEDYPLPPQPTGSSQSLESVAKSLHQPSGREIVSIGPTPTYNQPLWKHVKLTRDFVLETAMTSPGMVEIYINGAKVSECDSYEWSYGCSDGGVTLGVGNLAGVSAGQTVTIEVVPLHFTLPNAWEVNVYQTKGD